MKKIVKIKAFFLCLTLLFSLITTQNLVTGDYSNLDGIQVYFLNSSNSYYFASFTGSSSSITAKLYLFLSETQSSIDGGNGVWAGMSFGKSSMINVDIVICSYNSTNKFSCIDSWSEGNVTPKPDTNYGGKNNINLSNGTITTISVDNYKTLITWSFTKDISNLDSYDWNNFASWQTNSGAIAGSYGYLNSSSIPSKHVGVSSNNVLSDGSGFRNSITVNTSENAASTTPNSNTNTSSPPTTSTSTNTQTPTSSTSTQTTTSTSATTQTPTSSTSTQMISPNTTTTDSTTKNSIQNENNAKGLKSMDFIFGLFCTLLIVVI
jgi:hypothetical protein